ncbi:TPA: hypothetical protein ACX6QC_002689 [Photobacterium damselae]
MGLKQKIIIAVISMVAINVRAVGLIPATSIYRNLNVDTSFDKKSFFQKEILDFKFIKGDWDVIFNIKTKTFEPITDKMILQTNISKSEMATEIYQLTLSENESKCTTRDGNDGSSDFVNVQLDGKLIPSSDIGRPIGSGFSFQNAAGSGLSSEHDVKIIFNGPFNLGVDRLCSGYIRFDVSLAI